MWLARHRHAARPHGVAPAPAGEHLHAGGQGAAALDRPSGRLLPWPRRRPEQALLRGRVAGVCAAGELPGRPAALVRGGGRGAGGAGPAHGLIPTSRAHLGRSPLLLLLLLLLLLRLLHGDAVLQSWRWRTSLSGRRLAPLLGKRRGCADCRRRDHRRGEPRDRRLQARPARGGQGVARPRPGRQPCAETEAESSRHCRRRGRRIRSCCRCRCRPGIVGRRCRRTSKIPGARHDWRSGAAVCPVVRPTV